MSNTVHVAVYDTLADWEIGHAIAHIRKPDWQREPDRYTVVTVAATAEPVTTMGGLRIVPDLTLADLHASDSAMLVLAGNDIWPDERFAPFVATAREFLAEGRPVAAICGATGGLALAGLLDGRAHTSNAREFLVGLGYGGEEHYRDEPVVDDGGLITGNAVYPVEFARAILARLEVYEPSVLASWYKLYGEHDPAGFYELMAA